jgi:hypothetical protein
MAVLHHPDFDAVVLVVAVIDRRDALRLRAFGGDRWIEPKCRVDNEIGVVEDD